MSKVYLGVDVGSKGFITLNIDGEFTFYSIADLDFYQISDILRNIRNNYKDVVCTIEEVHAIHNSSAKATFAFGEINGILKGLLIANKIPYHLVQPKVWQGVIWENKDIVVKYKTIKDKKTNKEKSKKVIDTKASSFNAAKRLFPNIDLRRTDKCKNLDDNKCDSLLICEYGKRKNF